jgi:hypothetical protein
MRSSTTRRFALSLAFAASISVGALAEPVAEQSASGLMSEKDVTTFAMKWFAGMQKGRTDRSQYTSAYAAQITNQYLAEMSKALNRYGASPLRAELVETWMTADQTFDVVKFVFPRGDATSILFGFDKQGKITGIAIGGLAGD